MSRPAIVIPVHNRREVTLHCLRELNRLGASELVRTIVVDDGSTDGTAAAIATEFPEVLVLPGNGSLWWTGAIAGGSGRAFADGAPAVIWLNDDCVPTAGALESLLAHLAANPEAIIAPTCYDVRTGAAVPTGFQGRRSVTAAPGKTLPVDGLSGFCVGVPRAVWKKLGAPDAFHFPHYAGDTAYTWRATRLGVPVLLLGDVVVTLLDHRAPPASPGAARRPERSWSDNYRAIFLSRKSPFRLATQWNLLRLKYGLVTGVALASLRTVVWHMRFVLGR